MNALERLIIDRPGWTRVIVLSLALLTGWAGQYAIWKFAEARKLEYQQIQAQRAALSIVSQTIEGPLIGALGVIGTVDPNAKQEINGLIPMHSPKVMGALESVARAYGADGTFLVDRDGLVGSAWDASGMPSTGLKIDFRPYVQQAMLGIPNIYAAVSLKRGNRSLYFSAPMYADTVKASKPIGAVVAYSGLAAIENLMDNAGDISLLLSPQGVVFASNRRNWVGRLEGEVTSARVTAIRDARQFGAYFSEGDPARLPIPVHGGVHTIEGKRYAVAQAPVNWNDPGGDWHLVIYNDISNEITGEKRVLSVVVIFAIATLIGSLGVGLLRNHYLQARTSNALNSYAQNLEAGARRKSAIELAGVRMHGSDSLAGVARTFLSELHALFGALQGVVYRVDGNRHLTLLGTYACDGKVPESVAFGDGLLGQCAVDLQRRVLTTDLPDFTVIHSGLGEVTARQVIIVPALLAGKLMAVVEIAMIHPLQEADLVTLDEMILQLAMSVEIVDRKVTTDRRRATSEDGQ